MKIEVIWALSDTCSYEGCALNETLPLSSILYLTDVDVESTLSVLMINAYFHLQRTLGVLASQVGHMTMENSSMEVDHLIWCTLALMTVPPAQQDNEETRYRVWYTIFAGV